MVFTDIGITNDVIKYPAGCSIIIAEQISRAVIVGAYRLGEFSLPLPSN